MIDVAVVGAGISGLAAAVKLQRAGHSVVVLESDARPGGKIHTERHGPYQVESGPHSFLGSSQAVWQLLGEASLVDAVQPATSKARIRYIYRDGKIHALPLNPFSFLSSRLLSTTAKLRLLAEPFVAGAASTEDTVHDFITRRLGQEAAEFLAGPFVSGIYAGDPHKLGALDSFPTLWEMERDSGSLLRGAFKKALSAKGKSNGVPRRRGLFSFQGGLEDLVTALVSRLGPDVSLQSPVDSIQSEGNAWCVRDIRARAVIMATPPHRAAGILGDPLAATLNEIRLAPVAVVHLGCSRSGDLIPPGFGCLIPRCYGIRTLGTVFVSQIFAGRAPENGALIASYIGGTMDPDLLKLSDEELVGIAIADFKQVTAIRLAPDFTHVRKHRQGIPQLEVGHRRRIEHIHKLTDTLPGLFLAGNFLRGVGVNDAVASGISAAHRAMHYLRGQ